MFPKFKVTEIYCMADDLCKEFALQQKKYMVENKNCKHRNKLNRMSDTEIMVILILFHSRGFRCFKHYYKEYVCKHLSHLFPSPVSYNRFVELCGLDGLHQCVFGRPVECGTFRESRPDYIQNVTFRNCIVLETPTLYDNKEGDEGWRGGCAAINHVLAYTRGLAVVDGCLTFYSRIYRLRTCMADDQLLWR